MVPRPGVEVRQHNIGPATHMAHNITDCLALCLSDEELNAVGPFYLVSMSGEVKYPTQEVNV